MTRAALPLAVCLAISPPTGLAAETVAELADLCRHVETPKTAEQILDASKCLGFMEGFSEGYVYGGFRARVANRGVPGYRELQRVCPPAGATFETLAKMFVGVSDANPNMRDRPPADVMFAVWANYFSCDEKPK